MRPQRKIRRARREPTYGTGPESNPGHIGGRPALSPLHHPCSFGRLGEFSKVMQILDYVSSLHNCLEFSKPTSCLDEAMCFLFLLHFLLLFSQSPPTLISKILAPLAKNVGSYYPQVFESRHVQTSFTFPGWFEKSGFHYLFVVLGRTIDKTAGKLNFYIPSNLY